MPKQGPNLALGLMSRPAADGIDAAILKTDGLLYTEPGPARAVSYDPALRDVLREAATLARGWDPNAPMPEPLRQVSALVTRAHTAVAQELLAAAGLAPEAIDVVGFHAQTVLHRPQEARAVQLGDGATLARSLGIDVVSDFQRTDMAAGGQGAPLVPAYLRARAFPLPAKPLAVLNIGGISNITYIGADGALLSFDTGPGNGPLEDWAEKHPGLPIDQDGQLALRGRIDAVVLEQLLAHPYFTRRPPKWFDGLDFDLSGVARLSAADGAATLTAFAIGAIRAGLQYLPGPPKLWLVTGAGRHNPILMGGLAAVMGAPVKPVEEVGWRGDTLDAEAFAYLAVRSLKGLPLTEPNTTGVPRPSSGGVFHAASGEADPDGRTRRDHV